MGARAPPFVHRAARTVRLAHPYMCFMSGLLLVTNVVAVPQPPANAALQSQRLAVVSQWAALSTAAEPLVPVAADMEAVLDNDNAVDGSLITSSDQAADDDLVTEAGYHYEGYDENLVGRRLDHPHVRHQAGLFFAHIPKTAGESLTSMLHKIIAREDEHGLAFIERERAPDASELLANMAVTVLRSPRQHVLSQFMHCKYFRPRREKPDPGNELYGRYIDAMHFPTYNQSGEEADLRGLEQWVDHALSTDPRASVEVNATWPRASHAPLKAPTGRLAGAVDSLHFDAYMFGCYSPWNLQSRTLALSQPAKSSLRPEWDEIESSLEQYSLVGVSEHLDASLCITAVVALGVLPPACAESTGVYRSPIHDVPHESHGIPHLDEGSVPERVLRKIDELTTVDLQAYKWARDRFLSWMCALKVRRDFFDDLRSAATTSAGSNYSFSAVDAICDGRQHPVDSYEVPLRMVMISDQPERRHALEAWTAEEPQLKTTFLDFCDGAEFLRNSHFFGERYADAFRSVRPPTARLRVYGRHTRPPTRAFTLAGLPALSSLH